MKKFIAFGLAALVFGVVALGTVSADDGHGNKDKDHRRPEATATAVPSPVCNINYTFVPFQGCVLNAPALPPVVCNYPSTIQPQVVVNQFTGVYTNYLACVAPTPAPATVITVPAATATPAPAPVFTAPVTAAPVNSPVYIIRAPNTGDGGLK